MHFAIAVDVGVEVAGFGGIGTGLGGIFIVEVTGADEVATDTMGVLVATGTGGSEITGAGGALFCIPRK